MSVQVALLRAVNVGGNGKLPMAELRALATKIGLKECRSLLQAAISSSTPVANAGPIGETVLEAACVEGIRLKTAIYVRTPAELDAVLARNPFPIEAREDPSHLVVLFMREAPAAECFQGAAGRHQRPRDRPRRRPPRLVTYPDGIGQVETHRS